LAHRTTWLRSDLALLSAAGPEAAARDAVLRARTRLAGAHDWRVQGALDETAALLGAGAAEAAHDDEVAPSWTPAPMDLPLLADDASFDQPAFELPLLTLDAPDDVADDAVVEQADDVVLEMPAVAVPASVGVDPLAAALDAALASVPDDAADDEPEVLTPGVDMSDVEELVARSAEHATARPGQPAGHQPGRVAAIDAIVEMTEAAQQPAGGGLRSLFRRLTRR
ncbi:hypothetical protein PYV61_03645, partial [Roseisolibacter sp. H3M3-2]